MIPLLTLGIPGDGVTALLLGAFMLHGITPGPTMFTKQGVMAYTIIIGCLVANIFLYPIGKALTRAVAKVIQVRYTYLACAIIMFCFAGAFAAAYALCVKTGMKVKATITDSMIDKICFPADALHMLTFLSQLSNYHFK